MKDMVLESILQLEPDLDIRIQSAKERARKIANGNIETEKDLIDFFKYYISQKTGLPFFDPYFNDRTPDELAFEAELLSLKDRSQESLTSDIINENKEEADGLFEDWEKEDKNDFNFEEEAKKFMQTGKFVGENQ